jgi:hypothetical protein
VEIFCICEYGNKGGFLFHAGVDSSLLFDACLLAGFKGKLKSVFSFKISYLKGISVNEGKILV